MSVHVKLALKSADLIIREYVRNLESQIARSQKIIAKLECNNMAQKHKIAALKKKLNAYLKKGHLTVIVNRNVGEKN